MGDETRTTPKGGIQEWIEGVYTIGGAITVMVVGSICFIGCWIYAIVSWGFLLGIPFGWIPAGIIAWIVAAIAARFWPLLVAALIAGVIWFVTSFP